MRLHCVVGAQFGSEAKGHVTQRLIHHEMEIVRWNQKIVNVRVAGPNAGHTGHTQDGIAVPFRQLPMGALTPSIECVIAAGSEIEPAVLLQEIDQAIRYADFDPRRLRVDPAATVLEEGHKVTEDDAQLTERIGSTGKGVGAARAHRILRTAHTVGDRLQLVEKLEGMGVIVADTARWMALDDRIEAIIVEGTQGWGLGLHTPFYPFTTSADCRAIDFLAMAGINPWWYDFAPLKIWAVARVYPIRVAGNSGPLKDETTWDALGLKPEFTTVTKKMRRVGGWDPDLVRSAVIANGGGPHVSLAITMLDQKFPELKSATSRDRVRHHEEAWRWLNSAVVGCGAPVELVTTSPNTGVWL